MKRQQFLDRFYFRVGPCCAGCDWWRSMSSLIGECTKSAPTPGMERIAMLGIESPSKTIPAGHVVTPREHYCGDFKDVFEWETLPAHYLRQIGYDARIRNITRETPCQAMK